MSNLLTYFQEAWAAVQPSKPPKNPTADQLMLVAREFSNLYSHLSSGIHLPNIDAATGIALDPARLGAKFVALMKLACMKAQILFHEV